MFDQIPNVKSIPMFFQYLPLMYNVNQSEDLKKSPVKYKTAG